MYIVYRRIKLFTDRHFHVETSPTEMTRVSTSGTPHEPLQQRFTALKLHCWHHPHAQGMSQVSGTLHEPLQQRLVTHPSVRDKASKHVHTVDIPLLSSRASLLMSPTGDVSRKHEAHPMRPFIDLFLDLLGTSTAKIHRLAVYNRTYLTHSNSSLVTKTGAVL